MYQACGRAINKLLKVESPKLSVKQSEITAFFKKIPRKALQKSRGKNLLFLSVEKSGI